jgi:outer membrane lipoprotein SlyB
MNLIFRILGIILLFATSSVFSVPACYAQKSLNKIISISEKGRPVSQVLKSIGEKGGFYFSYNSDIIPGDSLVNLTVTEKPVKQILDLLFRDNYQYKEKGSYVIIQRAQREKTYVVAGHVYDISTGQPADYVSVYSRQVLVSALSEDDGSFRLRIRETSFPFLLTVSKIGYGDTIIVVSQADISDLKINISPKAIDLDPVFVKYSEGDRTWLGRLFVSSKLRKQSQNIGQFFVALPYQASLTPGLGTHGRMSAQVVNKVSLNILGGYTAGTNGVEVAGGFNISKTDVRYVQMAGVFNQVSGNVHGVQVAGFLNNVLDSIQGVQVSGFMGVVAGNIRGVQISGFSGVSRNDLRGVQVSGAAGFSIGNVHGAQISGAFNNAAGSFHGVQISGVINRVKSEMKGVQISGLANLSKGNTEGLQFGVINYAKKLKGTQIGIVNVADSSGGYSIGLINIIKKSSSNISIYSNEIVPFNIGWRMGTHKFYSMLLVGSTVGNTRKAYTFGVGIGKEFKVSKGLGISGELTNQNIFLGNWEDLPSIFRFQAALNLKLGNRFTLFAGPSISVFSAGQNASEEGYKSFPLTQYPGFNQNQKYPAWFGWQGGISWRYGSN